MDEKDINVFVSEHVMPLLDDFREFLSNAGWKNRMTIADDAAPGISFRQPEDEREIFATFLIVRDDEENERPVLRFSYRTEAGRAYRRWSVPYDRINDIQTLKDIIDMFFAGVAEAVFPPAEAVGEVGAEDESIEEMEQGRVLPTVVLLPRLFSLSSYLEEEEFEHSGVVETEFPFIQVAEEDLILTLSYDIWDDNTFLFSIRTDIPAAENADNEDLKELCEEFNEESSFAKANFGYVPFPVYGGEVMDGKTVSLCLTIPEFGGMPDGDDYALAISVFLDEAHSLMGIPR